MIRQTLTRLIIVVLFAGAGCSKDNEGNDAPTISYGAGDIVSTTISPLSNSAEVGAIASYSANVTYIPPKPTLTYKWTLTDPTVASFVSGSETESVALECDKQGKSDVKLAVTGPHGG